MPEPIVLPAGHASELHTPDKAMILNREQLARECLRLRGMGRRVVFTNGCFDVLHAGHVQYLQGARALGDVLVLGLNSDDSVSALKGPLRPVVPQGDRAAILDALRCVDYVTLFGEPTPLQLISTVEPDVLVKGGDYDPDATDGPRAIVGADLVRARGGMVRVIPLKEGRSTTDIIARILQAYGAAGNI